MSKKLVKGKSAIKPKVVVPAKPVQKKPKKQVEDYDPTDFESIVNLPQFAGPDYEKEEELLPLVQVSVKIRDIKEDKADVMVKTIYEKLKTFDGNPDFEVKKSVCVNAF